MERVHAWVSLSSISPSFFIFLVTIMAGLINSNHHKGTNSVCKAHDDTIRKSEGSLFDQTPVDNVKKRSLILSLYFKGLYNCPRVGDGGGGTI